MPDLAAPAPLWFVIATVAVIFAIIGVGILAVRRAKKAKDKM